jgi:hypothetical protein
LRAPGFISVYSCDVVFDSDYQVQRDAFIADGLNVYSALSSYFFNRALVLDAGGDVDGSLRHRWCGQLLGAYRTSDDGFGISDRAAEHLDGPWHAAPAACYELYLKVATDTGEHAIVRAAFVHGLWETRSIWKHITPKLVSYRELIEDVVLTHIEAAESYRARSSPPKHAMTIADHWRTALRFAQAMNRTDLVSAKVELLRGAIADTMAVPVWAHKLVELEVDLAADAVSRKLSASPPARLESLERVLDQLDDALANAGSKDYVRHSLLRTRAEIEGLLGRPPSTERMAERRARVCAASAESEASHLLKAKAWRDAAEQFGYAGLDDDATHAKQHMREETRRAHAAGELRPSPIQIPLDEATPRAIVNAFLSEPTARRALLNVLFRDGQVSLEGIDTSAHESPTSLADMFSTIQLVDDRMHAVIDPDSSRARQLRTSEFLKLVVEVQNLTILVPLFRGLRERFALTADDLVEVLSLSNATRSADLVLAFPGLRAFLRDDYVSALHILIPRLESMLRAYLERGGADTTTIDNGLSRERTLGGLLEKGVKAGLLSAAQFNLLALVLTDENGFNLRNKVAHGLASPADFAPGHACRILQLMLLVSRLSFGSRKVGSHSTSPANAPASTGRTDG